MAHVVVVGAGPVGLVTAMLLAADGQRVTLVDADGAALREETAVAASETGEARDINGWKRPGVRQYGQPHIIMPGGMRLLEHELPTAVDAVRVMGGCPFNGISGAWGVGAVGPEEPGDARFETLMLRRSLLEAALLATARRAEGITLRRSRVTGLVTGSAGTQKPPRITGVRTDDGTLEADLVVDAAGRDTRLPTLLGETGAAYEEPPGNTGFRYYSRFFRSADGSWPAPRRGLLTHHNSVSIITMPADRGIWSVTFVTSGRDQTLRALADGDAWDRAAAQYPEVAGWLAGEPLNGVVAMGGMGSRRRVLQRDGVPLVTGLVPVGDAWATTNPSFGMGMTMGFQQAVLVRDQLRKTGTADPAELILSYDRATEETLMPLWNDAVSWDRHRLAEIDEEIRGRTYTTDDPDWNLRNALDAVCLEDPALLRAVADVGFLLRTAEEALAGPGLLERAAELGAGVPRYVEPGPDRAGLLGALRVAEGE